MLSKENYYALLEHYISSAEYWKREWFDDLVGGHTNTTCSFENYWEFKKSYWNDWIHDEKVEHFAKRLSDTTDFIALQARHIMTEYNERKAVMHG